MVCFEPRISRGTFALKNCVLSKSLDFPMKAYVSALIAKWKQQLVDAGPQSITSPQGSDTLKILIIERKVREASRCRA